MEEIEKLIADLQPRAARYDTPIADDLLLCTFPNGIKTWIFTYTTNGFEQRRSIGVYPEMSLADARQALVAARKLQRVEDHLTEHGLASEIVRQATPEEIAATSRMPVVQEARRWLERRTIGAAIAGGLMSIAILLGVRQLPYEFFFPEHAEAQAVPSAAPAAAATAARPAEVAPAPQPETAPPVTTDADEPAPAPVAATQPEAETPAPVTLSPANQALLAAQEKLRGSVAREVLARALDANLRAVDPFDATLSVEPDAPAMIHYVTDVRGMAGRTVLHRWFHEGKLVSESKLEVGPGWLSTLRSSAVVAPQMTGRWEVRLCDASGTTLESATFDVEPAIELTSIPAP